MLLLSFTAAALDRIYGRLLPRYHAAVGYLVAVFTALSQEMDSNLNAAIADLKLQALAHTATWTLPYWERMYGLSPDDSLSVEQRQQRVLTRKIGPQVPSGIYLEQIVQDMLSDTGRPQTTIYRPRVFVYKPLERGWPGDALFAAVQSRLRVAGRGAANFWLASWDSVNGLTYAQANQESYAALNSLSYREVNGP